MKKFGKIIGLIILFLIVGYFLLIFILRSVLYFISLEEPLPWLTHFNKVYVDYTCACPDRHPQRVCIYHSKGDDINKILTETQSYDCTIQGCDVPVEYKYCD